MKNEINIFENEKFGQVRTICNEENEIWFAAKDVAISLGYSNPQKAIRDHCKGVNTGDFNTTGGMQTLNIIKESDVYRLIMRSKLESAIEFQDWLVEEVLPSIRKNGGYMVDNDESPEDLFSRALKMADGIIKERDLKVQVYQNKLEQAKPMIEFAEQVSESVDAVEVGDFAKAINDENISIGRNRLKTFLNKVLDKIPKIEYAYLAT